eukprot:5395917-Pyramimonas_sp.AAC.1
MLKWLFLRSRARCVGHERHGTRDRVRSASEGLRERAGGFASARQSDMSDMCACVCARWRVLRARALETCAICEWCAGAVRTARARARARAWLLGMQVPAWMRLSSTGSRDVDTCDMAMLKF